MHDTTTLRHITAGDRKIAFDAPNGSGDGPGHIVLMIHGSSLNRSIWEDVGASLAGRHRPIWFDNPAHGASSGPPATSVDELADLVGELRAALGIERLLLIGHSLGGAVAQRVFARDPQGILGLGLISTAPHFGLTDEVVEHWMTDPAAYREEEIGMCVAPVTGDDVRDRLLRIRDSTSPEGQRGDLVACAAWDGRGTEHRITVPALVMTAEHDVPVIVESAQPWVDALPHGTLADIPAAGHFMMVEQPHATAKAITDWVDGIAVPA